MLLIRAGWTRRLRTGPAADVAKLGISLLQGLALTEGEVGVGGDVVEVSVVLQGGRRPREVGRGRGGQVARRCRENKIINL